MLQSCEVETLLEPNLRRLKQNPIQLQQVLLNLTINLSMPGRYAGTPSQGSDCDGKDNDGAIRVSVRDYGWYSGKRRRSIEQFFTTKAKGLGMGLAIVRSIVESTRTIVAENADGVGARFCFTLSASAQLCENSFKQFGLAMTMMHPCGRV